MIEVRDLKIHYGDLVAVDQVYFSVSPGSIFGLIGPNGAGKTSVLKAIASLLEPTYGDILVNGKSVLHQPEKARCLLGYMPDFPPVYEDLKVWEFCDYFAHAYGLRGEDKRSRVLECLLTTSLNEHKHQFCKTLSRGMKQRALLAKTLVHDPSVLLLDEPAANLDPKSRIELRNILKKLADSGKTILISSHVLSEIEDTCDSIGFMQSGKMVKSGTLEEVLRNNPGTSVVRIHLSSPAPKLPDVVSQIPALSGLELISEDRLRFEVTLKGNQTEASQVLAQLVSSGIPVSEFSCQKQKVEDLFLQLESQPLNKQTFA